MNLSRSWRLAIHVGIVLASTAALTLLIHTASAGPVPALSPTAIGGVPVAIRATRDKASHKTSSTTYADLPGATQAFSIPSGQSVDFFVRFSAESACSGTSSGWCSVRILVDGVEAAPAAGADFAFDSNDGGSEGSTSWESHSMDRSAGPLGAGFHTVKVQWATAGCSSSCPTFRLDDWSLTTVVAE